MRLFFIIIMVFMPFSALSMERMFAFRNVQKSTYVAQQSIHGTERSSLLPKGLGATVYYLPQEQENNDLVDSLHQNKEATSQNKKVWFSSIISRSTTYEFITHELSEPSFRLSGERILPRVININQESFSSSSGFEDLVLSCKNCADLCSTIEPCVCLTSVMIIGGACSVVSHGSCCCIHF